MARDPCPVYITILCPWKRYQGASNEAAFQRSACKTGNNEPHSNRRCSKKDGAGSKNWKLNWPSWNVKWPTENKNWNLRAKQLNARESLR